MDAVILLVEDEDVNVVLLKKALQRVRLNHLLIVMENGLKALEYFQGLGKYADRRAFPLPDLVLLDLNLPGVQGLDVLKWLRAQPAFNTLVVLILSTCEDPQDIHKAYRLGANSFLNKPADLPKFESMVRAIHDFWLIHNRPAPRLQGQRQP